VRTLKLIRRLARAGKRPRECPPKTKSAEVALDAPVPVRAVLRSSADAASPRSTNTLPRRGSASFTSLPGSDRPAPQGAVYSIGLRSVSRCYERRPAVDSCLGFALDSLRLADPDRPALGGGQ